MEVLSTEASTPVAVPSGRVNRYYNYAAALPTGDTPPGGVANGSGTSAPGPGGCTPSNASTPLTCHVTPPSHMMTPNSVASGGGVSGTGSRPPRVMRNRTVSLSDSPTGGGNGQQASPTGATAAVCKQHKRHSLFNNLKVLVGRTRSTSTSVSSGYSSGFTADTIDEDVEAGPLSPRGAGAGGGLLTACAVPQLRKRRVAAGVPLHVDAVCDLGEHMEVDDDDDCDSASDAADTAGRRHTCGNAELMLLRRNSNPLTIEFLGTIDCQHNPYTQFLRATMCYDVAPQHGRVVALDWTLPVHRALYYVLQSDPTECRGMVWTGSCFAGPVTLSDFLTVLHLGGHELLTTRDLRWLVEQRAQMYRLQPKDMVTAVTDMSLFDAVETMLYNRLHRLPVFQEDDQNSLLFWLGTKRIVQTFNRLLYAGTVRKWLAASVERARIGTWSDMSYATMDTTVADALALLLDQHISLLPVVESADNRRLLDTVSKRDIAHALGWHIADNGGVIAFADYPAFMRNTVAYVLERLAVPHNVDSCVVKTTDPLTAVVRKLATSVERCIFVTGDNFELIAAISTSELIRYIMEERQSEPCAASPSQRASVVSMACSVSPTDRKHSTQSANESAFSRSLDRPPLERMSSMR